MEATQTNQAERKRWNDERWTAAWPRRERLTDQVTPLLLDALAPRRGERVLDVGCGGGKSALAAALRVGSEGAVIGADISAPLTQLAEGRAAERRIGNVRFEVVDIQLGRIDGGPFDAAMSQFGVMFFDEPVRAFSNIRAHLRPGGRLVFACWQGIDRNPWYFATAVAGFVSPPPPPAPGKSPTGPFSLADPQHVQDTLSAAGFVGVTLSAHELNVEVPNDSVVDESQLRFMGVSEDKLADAIAAVARHLGAFRQPSGQSRFPLAFQIVTAHNPAA